MSLVPGFTLLLSGLFAMLAAAHFRRLRYFDRPALARNSLFDPILDGLKWILLLSGLVLILRASRAVFLATAAALLALWSYRRMIRSDFFQERLLRRDFVILRRSRPEMSDGEILFELTYRKHPRWGPELIEQMVHDYPSIESFARMLSRMEQGYRGFKGRGPSSR
ncbi:MAG TPA: hypothetical protein VEW47_01680 [Candidatus Dormibacteraeota bacterium]|nr:hypothetical protein [Candidatus Dormibacteraeota bacterium]